MAHFGKCHASHEACELKRRGQLRQCRKLRHASHEACELKLLNLSRVPAKFAGHASHEACELKLSNILTLTNQQLGHASHEACELKRIFQVRAIPFW